MELETNTTPHGNVNPATLRRSTHRTLSCLPLPLNIPSPSAPGLPSAIFLFLTIKGFVFKGCRHCNHCHHNYVLHLVFLHSLHIPSPSAPGCLRQSSCSITIRDFVFRGCHHCNRCCYRSVPYLAPPLQTMLRRLRAFGQNHLLPFRWS